MLRLTASVVRACPDRMTTIISANNFSSAKQSMCGPRKVISLPRTVIATEGNAASIILILLSPAPTSATMGMAGGTVIRVRSICG